MEKIAVIGLGYVGLPVAVALAGAYDEVIGFDISARRIAELRAGTDITGEIEGGALGGINLTLTCDEAALQGCSVFIVTVPTPIDINRKPDLGAVLSASKSVGRALKQGGLVIYESTVYPGVTEEICGPVLERESGLKQGEGFNLGYSPERINPGDKERTLKNVIKVVSADSAAALDRVAEIYGRVVEAGLYRAPTIKVAEAAKVLENTQRDINIALMNELAIILDKMDVRTADVLAAASTKWNFLPFKPGLVGGHCIGVDPYYLTAKAEEFGYHPQVILAGRRINDSMGAFVAQKTIKLLACAGKAGTPRVGILGVTFKENIHDIRNSKVVDIVRELREFGIEPLVHDYMADEADVAHEYGVRLAAREEMDNLDALILAVPHKRYIENDARFVKDMLGEGAVLIDVKAVLPPQALQEHAGIYWSL